MKNILLLAHDDSGQEARFQAALDLTRALNGHLICLGIPVMPIMVGDFYAMSAEVALYEDEQQREAENRKNLEARLNREDISWNWIEDFGEPVEAIREHAKLADVVVISRRLDNSPLVDMRQIASEVVVSVDKAVVAVPETAMGLDATGPAMVAWDGSEQAAKALQAAVPLLRLSRRVTVVEIGGQPKDVPAQEAAAYLSRHDIPAVIVRRGATSGATAEALIEEAEAEGAAYLVMGGFGRSRLVEAMFGGVTRDMLTETPIPVIMVH